LKRVLFGLLIATLLGTVTITLPGRQLKASYEITITNGTYYPSSAPISQTGNIYTLNGDLDSTTITVRMDSIILDGAGHTLKGKGVQYGIYLMNATDVVIRNITLEGYQSNIILIGSSFCTISDCNIVDSQNPLVGALHIIDGSTNNTIIKNNFRANNAIDIDDSSANNTLRQNDVTVLQYRGIGLMSNNNNVSQNTIRATELENETGSLSEGIVVDSSNNAILANNITDIGLGISIKKGSNNNVSQNTILPNFEARGIGISITDFTSGNTIVQNNITRCRFSIRIDSSHNNYVYQNTARNCTYGILIHNSNCLVHIQTTYIRTTYRM
jgi:parallel beta-helix repeat protein